MKPYLILKSYRIVWSWNFLREKLDFENGGSTIFRNVWNGLPKKIQPRIPEYLNCSRGNFSSCKKKKTLQIVELYYTLYFLRPTFLNHILLVIQTLPVPTHHPISIVEFTWIFWHLSNLQNTVVALNWATTKFFTMPDLGIIFLYIRTLLF